MEVNDRQLERFSSIVYNEITEGYIDWKGAGDGRVELWITDLKDWTWIKDFGPLQRMEEDWVQLKLLVPSLFSEDDTQWW